jgi:hypothetical protein
MDVDVEVPPRLCHLIDLVGYILYWGTFGNFSSCCVNESADAVYRCRLLVVDCGAVDPHILIPPSIPHVIGVAINSSCIFRRPIGLLCRVHGHVINRQSLLLLK